MNERIKELANLVAKDSTQHILSGEVAYVFSESELESFYKMIVDKCSKFVDEFEDPDCGYYSKELNKFVSLGDLVKENFGVEE